MTIYDIAKLANCSASTVSRVINNRGGVSKKKREEIAALLHKHNYVPDENARSLVMQTNRTIGILMDNTSSEHMSEGVLRIEYELMAHGYFCFIKLIEPTEEGITEGIQSLLRHRVAGALCMGIVFRDKKEYVSKEAAHYLADIPLVMVNHMQSFPNPNIYTVGTDERTGFENSVNLLVERGCRNLVLLLDKNRRSAHIIRRGFEAGLQNHPDVKGLVYENIPVEMEAGAPLCERILQDMPDVDGVIAARTTIGAGVLYALQDRNIKVPEDVMMISEGGDKSCKFCRPAMTNLDTMLTVCATLSANTILDVLNGRSVAHNVTLQLELHERASTAR